MTNLEKYVRRAVAVVIASAALTAVTPGPANAAEARYYWRGHVVAIDQSFAQGTWAWAWDGEADNRELYARIKADPGTAFVHDDNGANNDGVARNIGKRGYELQICESTYDCSGTWRI
ncbi:hypothetical protein [Streptomyces sp. NPDC058583]|uniref:hypothetical protein n=1 Tax=unclassified Streptomyces TaxID=2593676 RepID=UPI00365BB65A